MILLMAEIGVCMVGLAVKPSMMHQIQSCLVVCVLTSDVYVNC